jgi:NADPH-dependent curcumin reductase CurA
MLYDEDVSRLFLIATLAASALLLPAVPDEVSLTADQIVQRHVEAIGGAAKINAIQSLAAGVITARIGSTLGLDGAPQMLEQLRKGALRGKAVIRL